MGLAVSIFLIQGLARALLSRSARMKYFPLHSGTRVEHFLYIQRLRRCIFHRTLRLVRRIPLSIAGRLGRFSLHSWIRVKHLLCPKPGHRIHPRARASTRTHNIRLQPWNTQTQLRSETRMEHFPLYSGTRARHFHVHSGTRVKHFLFHSETRISIFRRIQGFA